VKTRSIDTNNVGVTNGFESSKAVHYHRLFSGKTRSIIADALEIPILFDEAAAQVGDRYQLDDEFARRLGVAMLNLLALSYPELKQDITASQAPKARD
jgi:hypothetical protein